MEILEAIRRSPQTEIRTNEVEWGLVSTSELNQPYPYRVSAGEDVYAVLVNDNGVSRWLETRWELTQNEAGGFSLLLYNGAEPEGIEITKQVRIASYRNYTHLVVG